MELLIVRHGAAEAAAADSAGNDAARRLTEKGRRQFRGGVSGLLTVVPAIDAIATSPFVRAVESARLLATAYKVKKPRKLHGLAPVGDREAILSWLGDQGENDTVALVGHEPHLGLLASWMLASPLNHFVELKTGGACFLAWPDSPSPGNAWLRWALTARQLRRLGRA